MTSATVQAPLKIMVADDDGVNRMVLKALLAKEGHTVLLVQNGREAVAAYQQEQPDLILMDIMMPEMDGYEATRRIKALASERFLPVVFLTALTDEDSLAKCIASGGDDFMTKPFNRIILTSKIQSYARLNSLYQTLRDQKEELAQHHGRIRHEYELAENIFTAIVDAGRLNAPNIKYRLSPMETISGDMLLAANTPSGGQHFLLGDFVGHGLHAAIGAIPASDIFYSMVAKGFHIDDIVREINQKLHAKLPTGFFLAACLVEVDEQHRTAQVWNGGIPDAVLLRNGSGVQQRFTSRNLPLGILNAQQLHVEVDRVELVPGDRLYIYSDGLIEATDHSGTMFGQERLERCFHEAGESHELFETINGRLAEFRGEQSQNDDISMVEITFN